jgi:membrane protein
MGLTRPMRTLAAILTSALRRFVAHDGWAIASHIALSALMSLFPFLIVVTAVAGLFGSAELADEVARLLLEAWPSEVAEPIAQEVRNVLTAVRGDALTVGALFALYFASSGVESLRIGLNRAYGVEEARSWFVLRLESIGFVIAGAFALIAFALLVVFGPLIWRTLLRWLPGLEPLGWTVTFLRLGVATAVVVIALVLAHLVLPAGRRRFLILVPGVLVTLLLWLVSGAAFGRYLESFSGAYVTAYAGLATAMIALVFLYWLAAIFLIGGEINAAIEEHLTERPAGGIIGFESLETRGLPRVET